MVANWGLLLPVGPVPHTDGVLPCGASGYYSLHLLTIYVTHHGYANRDHTNVLDTALASSRVAGPHEWLLTTPPYTTFDLQTPELYG